MLFQFGTRQTMLKTSRCPKRADEKSGALFSRKERPKRAERSFREKSGRKEQILENLDSSEPQCNKIEETLQKSRARTKANFLVGVAGKKLVGAVGFDQKPLIRALTRNCRMFLLISLSLRSSLLSLLLLFSCPCGRVRVLPDVIVHSIKAGTVLLLLTTHNDRHTNTQTHKHTNTQTHKTCPVVLSCVGPTDKTSSPTTEGRQAIRHPKPADFARILGPIGQRRTAFRAPSLFLGGNWSLGTVTDDVTMTTT